MATHVMFIEYMAFVLLLRVSFQKICPLLIGLFVCLMVVVIKFFMFLYILDEYLAKGFPLYIGYLFSLLNASFAGQEGFNFL